MKHRNDFQYIGKVIKAKHGQNGVRYRHRWDTGVQDLVFATHADAEKWITFQDKNKDKAI